MSARIRARARGWLGALVLAALPAHAHVMLERALPGAGASMPVSPAAVILRFDGTVVLGACHVSVAGGDGHAIAAGVLRHDDGKRDTLVLPLPELPPGGYRVHWVVETPDGHRTEGSYRFTVR